ncbi:1-acyl-sn-glycerol-3-phosphate acyltransferases [Paramicrobacterium humi]|uniref:1-acyl-sn-glycerol-3-phosphate acyltransferases n=1 Tax=Paramicrobacterium humi TaxID=640635 RepID=A0A1H4TIZ9_9MICO|nr:lysophospholipid acyltransferase family protein [Microbacterium humi]SEC56432.1 1-acyl-sn-glycerol-3-phosphate acyltransferases [Microbacterium humi]
MPHTPDDASPVPPTRNTEKSRPSVYWFLAAVILPLARLLMTIKIIDGQKLPKTGAFILAPNHYSEIDPIVIGIATWKMGRIPRFMAKASLFRIPFVGWLLTKAGQIPVEREGSTRGNGPIEAAGKLVDTGRGVIVYPEGTLTRDPDMWPMRGKTGAARMALTHGLPVIPVAHWGTQKVMARYAKKISLFPPKKVTIKVGDPIDLSAYRDRPIDSSTLNEVTTVIMNGITAQLEDIRGEKAPAERWDPAKHNQRETGRFES